MVPAPLGQNHPPMELLARGRDCDIFDLGDGTVLRRSRRAHDLGYEARVLRYVAEHGYPVPRVHDLRDEGRELVLDKIEGPTMGEALRRRPWKAAAIGRQLAELHRGLHAIPAPDWVRPLSEGDALVHLDLHPLNVMLAPSGPVVIDWTNASRGRPGHDSARAWVLMAHAGVEEMGRAVQLVAGPLRRRLVEAFLGAVGRKEAVDCLRFAVEITLLDGNISEAEKAGMRRLLEEVAGT